MNFWADPARDQLCAMIDSLCGAPDGTASECFALIDGEPVTPFLDATLAAIHAAVGSGSEIDEVVENELRSCDVSVLCIMVSEVPEIATSNDCHVDGMTEDCIADMLENRLRYWFKARCDHFDFWLSAYLARAGIETDSSLADGTPLGDVCRQLVASSSTSHARARRDLTLTRERGGNVLRYFEFAAKNLI